MAYDDNKENEAREYDMQALFRHAHRKTQDAYSQMSTSVARSRQNLQLNRYNNVSPNDEHRVRLEPYNNNDYINASIARSSSDPVESGQFYILAQGPLPVTCFDTWRMSWQYKSRAIIMLNKLIEQGKNKCHRYWPEVCGSTLIFKGTEQKNDLYFTVTLKAETPYSKEENDTIFIVRELEVVRYEDDEAVETRQFKHFHYVAWPDFGVPATPDDFGQFYDELEDYKCFSNPYSPSVVHCSAGIGRTGTLCLVNSLLKKLEKDPQSRNKMVDHYQIVEIVFDELIFMRQFRLGLIQTGEQLEFCLKAIKWLHNRSVKQRRELQSESMTSESVTSPSSTGDSNEHTSKEITDNSMEETIELPVANDELPVDELPVTNENGNTPTPSSKTEEPRGDKDHVTTSDELKMEERRLLTNEERRLKIEQIKQRMKSEEIKNQKWNQLKLPLLIGTIAIGIGLFVYFRPLESAATTKAPISEEL